MHWRLKKIKHISPTGTLLKYLECPLQFWFYKISDLKIDEEKKDYLVYGEAFHYANEEALKSKRDFDFISLDEVKESFNAYVDKATEDVGESFWSKTNKKTMKSDGASLIDLAVKRYSSMPIEPLMLETELEYQYKDKAKLFCKVDLVAEFKDKWKARDGTTFTNGDVVIIDHKTAAQRYSKSAADFSPQLSFYSYIYRKLFGKEEDFVGFQVFMKYTKPEIQDYFSSREGKDIIIFEELLDRVIENIENGIFYPTYNQKICDRCDYSSYCTNYASKKDRDFREAQILESIEV